MEIFRVFFALTEMCKSKGSCRITRFHYKCWSSTAEGKGWKATFQKFSAGEPSRGEHQRWKPKEHQ